MMVERRLILEHVMQPGTGKALELLRGQVLRIEQVEDGAQCADSNFFNLHDYKEFFHAARTRHLHGMNPGAFRHPDHRFEWDRPKFRRWACGVAARHGYSVAFHDIGDCHPTRGASTQMASFTLDDGSKA